jgi:phage protein D
VSSAAAAVISPRPTFSVGGQDRAALPGGLLALRIEEHVDGLYHCEATFGNWGATGGSTGFLYFDQKVLDFGKDFDVSFAGKKLFSGRVSGLEAEFAEASPPTITVLAEDRFQDLRMTRRTRTWENTTDKDVATQIAGDHGLTPDLDLQGPQHKVLAQVNQSDLAFLRDRARALGAELWIDGTTLSVKPRASRGGAPLSLGLGSSIRHLTVGADLADQRTGVDVTGWDVAAKDALDESAGDQALGSELKGGKSGATILRSTLGDRKEAVVRTVPLSGAEARARAESIFRRRARRFLTGWGVAEPNADLAVGVAVRIDALGPLFSGEFYVSHVRHVFDSNRGLRTEFAIERPGLGQGQ